MLFLLVWLKQNAFSFGFDDGSQWEFGMGIQGGTDLATEPFVVYCC